MKKYYGLFIIPLLGIISINSGIKTNLGKSNLKEENAAIISIETSYETSTAIIDTNLDGYGDTLYMWGYNSMNRLVDDTRIDKPEKIDFDWGGNIINVETAYLGAYGVSVDTDYNGYADTIYMWGDNYNGRLGDGTTNPWIYYPKKITPKKQNDWGGNIIDYQVGSYESIIIIDTDLDGYADTLYAWGLFNELHTDVDENILYPEIITPKNQDNWDGNITNLSIGTEGVAIAIDNNNKVEDDLYIWQWGSNPVIYYDYPTMIYPDAKEEGNWGHITSLNVGESYDINVISDSDYDGYSDSIYLWGENNSGMLGNGERDNIILIPDNNKFIATSNIINAEFGSEHTGVIVDTNLDNKPDTLYMFGSNQNGQIGNGDLGTDVLSPTIITPEGQTDWGGDILEISISKKQSMILLDQDQDGLGDTVYVWGSNLYSQLGLGKEYKNVDIPTILATTYY